MQLDPRTILLLMAFTAVPTALVLLAVSRFYAAQVRGVKHWTGANIALAIGLLLLGLSQTANDLPARVGGNTLLVLTAALYYLAIMRLLNEKPNARLAWTTVIVSGVIFAMLWATNGHYRLAVATLSVALILLTGLSAARLLLPVSGERRVSHRFTGLLFLLGCILMAVRLVHILFSAHPPGNLFASDFWHGMILGGTHITVMLMSLGFALMIVDQLASELNRLATLDALTGIGNRRVFYTRAEAELARCRRKNTPLSLLMIDLDRFKAINDALGHAAGDETLRRFASLVGPHLREYDFFARLGGEEFVVLLPDATEDFALAIAERLRELTMAEHLPSPGFPVPTTASIGVAQLHPDDTSIDPLLQRADQALYAAKHGGRNRVVAASWLVESAPAPDLTEHDAVPPGLTLQARTE
ncbi:MAG: GGDEF domain-containing protein [Betaproteobacteria bacterium]|nr:GGDEF domain-containing protein [Betaproteobacteria bacterium]